MYQSITANDLKTKGISAISEALKARHEAIITVRGKQEFVVLPLDEYNRLRECELEAALAETKREIRENRYFTESVDKHIKRITGV